MIAQLEVAAQQAELVEKISSDLVRARSLPSSILDQELQQAVASLASYFDSQWVQRAAVAQSAADQLRYDVELGCGLTPADSERSDKVVRGVASVLAKITLTAPLLSFFGNWGLINLLEKWSEEKTRFSSESSLTVDRFVASSKSGLLDHYSWNLKIEF